MEDEVELADAASSKGPIERRTLPEIIPNSITYKTSAINKPEHVVPVLHFRVIQLFAYWDPQRTGWADWKPEMESTIKEALRREFHDERSVGYLIREVRREVEAWGGGKIDIFHFLGAVERVQVMKLGKLNKKRGEIALQKKRLHLEQDELLFDDGPEVTKMSAMQRRWSDFKSWATRVRNSRRYGIIPIWRRWFIQIEAVFGGNVVAYFLFAQYVFWLNVVISLMFLPILIPGFTEAQWDYVENWAGLLIGSGMEKTPFFYGFYPPTLYGYYRIDLLWFLCCSAMMVVSGVVVLSGMSERFDLHREDQKKYKFSRLVFAQFDHNVRDVQSIKLQQAALETQLKATVIEREEREVWKKIARQTPNYVMWTRIRRGAGWGLSVLFGLGTGGFVGWLIYNENKYIVPNADKSPQLRYFSTLLVPALIGFFKASSPTVMKKIVQLERYTRAKDAFRAVFFRIFVVMMFYVLVVLFNTIYKTTNRGTGTTGACKETQVGIIYYKMIVVDLITSFMMSIVIPYFKLFVLFTCCKKKFSQIEDREIGVVKSHFSQLDASKTEFLIPENIIDIMYFQALVWSGTPYCPFLPVVAVISAFVQIAIKIFHVQHLCRPPIKPMGIARQNHYFRSLLLVTLGVTLVPYSFFLRRDAKCGPHEGNDPLSVLYGWIDQSPSWFALPFAYSQSSVLLWVLIVLVAIYAFFTKKREQLLRDELGDLRRRLQVELKEKSSILREGHVELEKDQDRGRTLFYTWMNELADLGEAYAEMFEAAKFNDLLQLASLEEKELRTLLGQFADETWRMPLPHIEFFIRQVERKRIDLIAAT